MVCLLSHKHYGLGFVQNQDQERDLQELKWHHALHNNKKVFRKINMHLNMNGIKLVDESG